jgi:hypothetical protein
MFNAITAKFKPTHARYALLMTIALPVLPWAAYSLPMMIQQPSLQQASVKIFSLLSSLVMVALLGLLGQYIGRVSSGRL